MGVLHFLDHGAHTGAFNMARDEYLFRSAAGAWLCVYAWEPAALSFGYGQKAEQELDAEAVRRAGFDAVRRSTGGRVVLHDCEITYAVAAEAGGPFGPDLHSAYHTIALALQKTLAGLGVAAELEKGNVRDARSGTGASAPCFASTARHELKVNGKKIIGSAQRREKGRFLQHGSLILRHRHDITDFLRLTGEEKAAYRDVLRRDSITLEEAAGRAFEWPRLSAAFRDGFSESLGMEIAMGGLPDDALREFTAARAR